MSTDAKPAALTVKPDGIPAELKALSRWVAWRYQRRRNRWAKVPLCCPTGKQADITDPGAWATFEHALDYYKRRQPDGIGFVFASADDYSGIDLDKCRNASTGDISPEKHEVIRAVDSYAEISPSGTGVKMIARGKLPPEWRKKKGGTELYSQGRYFALTGWHLPGTPPTVESRQQELVRLHEEVFGPMLPAGGTAAETGDAQIVAKAMQAANGQKFARLWGGDTTGYPSESEADLALACMLAYWAGHPGQIERLMGQSELGKRPKWRERADYRELTVHQAVKSCRNYADTGRVKTRTIQTFRIIQDQPGSVNTVVVLRPDRTEGQGLTPGLEGRAVEIAIALAETEGERPDWQVMFTLARKLRRLLTGNVGDPEQFESAVVAFCERANKPAEDYWFAFLTCWEKVKLAEGDTPLEWALSMARKHPVVTPPSSSSLWANYSLLGSMAYYLAEFRRPRPFLLPVEGVASLLNASVTTTWRIRCRLEKDGVIQCVKKGKYKERLADEFFYLGPPADAKGVA